MGIPRCGTRRVDPRWLGAESVRDARCGMRDEGWMAQEQCARRVRSTSAEDGGRRAACGTRMRKATRGSTPAWPQFHPLRLIHLGSALGWTEHRSLSPPSRCSSIHSFGNPTAVHTALLCQLRPEQRKRRTLVPVAVPKLASAEVGQTEKVSPFAFWEQRPPKCWLFALRKRCTALA